jgi:LysM repeat protein
VWEGRQYVPKGYRLRLPSEMGQLTAQQLAQRVDASEQFSGQPRPRVYVVRAGDTLTGVAARHGLGVSQLASLNGIKSNAMLKVGQKLNLPQTAPAATTPAPAQVAAKVEARREEARVVAQANAKAEKAEPVTAAEAKSQGPSLAPGAPAAAAADVM